MPPSPPQKGVGEGRGSSPASASQESNVAVAVDDARLSISTSDFKRMSHPVLAVEREAQPGDAIRASLAAGSREQGAGREQGVCPVAALQQFKVQRRRRKKCGQAVAFFPLPFPFCG